MQWCLTLLLGDWGPKNEKWKLDHHLEEIVELVSKVYYWRICCDEYIFWDSTYFVGDFMAQGSSYRPNDFRRIMPSGKDGHLLSTGSLIRIETVGCRSLKMLKMYSWG